MINGIPSSCKQDVCNFTFVDPPRVDAVYPLQGQGGTNIVLYGEGFTNVASDIEVVIGTATCHVTYSNDTIIACTTSDHTAGWYNIQVEIEGHGKAAVSEFVCFQYLLSVDYVSPSSVGVGGGQVVTITGNGFMQFVNYDREEFHVPEISSLPWFQYGIGLPYIKRLEYFNLCPAIAQIFVEGHKFLEVFTPYHVVEAINDIGSFLDESEIYNFDLVVDGHFRVESFYAHLFNVYFRLPSYVLIAGYPCIITESKFTEIKCVPTLNLPQSANLTVVVLTEYAHVEDVLEIDEDNTTVIDSIEPSVGAVVGDTLLTITGYNFNAYSTEDVTVFVGENPCSVTSANGSHIECILPPNQPSRQPVFVKTPSGVAVWEAALNELLDQLEMEVESGSGEDYGIQMNRSDSAGYPPFPIFTYKLVVLYDHSTPLRGSSLGGTQITVTGGIFVMGYTKVTFGGIEAEIESMNEREITFTAPTLTRTHYIGLRRTQLRRK